MNQERVDQITKVLEDAGVEWATLNVYLLRKTGCLLIPEEKWQAVTGALMNEVGTEGWKDEWEY